MTTISITKSQVIKAIKEEPLLRARTFADLPFIDYDDLITRQKTLVSDKKNCSVCAVGSVLRSVIEPNEIWEKINFAANHAHKNDYMRRLSNFFERVWDEACGRNGHNDLSRHQIYRIRLKTIAFVKKTFPGKIEIDINGIKVANGVKIVYPNL